MTALPFQMVQTTDLTEFTILNSRSFYLRIPIMIWTPDGFRICSIRKMTLVISRL